MTNDLHGGKMSICKCPECEDGFLVVKPVKNENGNTSYILGCTNYKKDGTGCKYKLNLASYTQDKDQLMKFYKNESSSNMSFCGLPIKELINNIYEIILKPKENYNSFNINGKSIIDVLVGKESKIITGFKLNKLSAYRSVDIKYEKKLWILIFELEAEKIIEINKENYNAINILKNDLTDEDIRIIFANLMQRK